MRLARKAVEAFLVVVGGRGSRRRRVFRRRQGLALHQAMHPLLVPAGHQRRALQDAAGGGVGFVLAPRSSATTRVSRPLARASWAPRMRPFEQDLQQHRGADAASSRPAISPGYIEKPSLLIGAPKRLASRGDAQVAAAGDLRGRRRCRRPGSSPRWAPGRRGWRPGRRRRLLVVVAGRRRRWRARPGTPRCRRRPRRPCRRHRAGRTQRTSGSALRSLIRALQAAPACRHPRR